MTGHALPLVDASAIVIKLRHKEECRGPQDVDSSGARVGGDDCEPTVIKGNLG